MGGLLLNLVINNQIRGYLSLFFLVRSSFITVEQEADADGLGVRELMVASAICIWL